MTLPFDEGVAFEHSSMGREGAVVQWLGRRMGDCKKSRIDRRGRVVQMGVTGREAELRPMLEGGEADICTKHGTGRRI